MKRQTRLQRVIHVAGMTWKRTNYREWHARDDSGRIVASISAQFADDTCRCREIVAWSIYIHDRGRLYVGSRQRAEKARERAEKLYSDSRRQGYASQEDPSWGEPEFAATQSTAEYMRRIRE
jgi:hypothetical protein